MVRQAGKPTIAAPRPCCIGRAALQSGAKRHYDRAMTESFELALRGRVDAMVDACTGCGKCVEVCPAAEPAGLSTEQRQNPGEVIGGVIDLLRAGAGNDAARKWASGCLLSGECIKACDYGVNPRFLLGMARVAMAKAKDDAATQRRAGVEGFRAVARDVNALSRLQCPSSNALGQTAAFRNGGSGSFGFEIRRLSTDVAIVAV